ncbi:MAG: NAD-dependent epimerase/dehydratase family protein [Actinomycetota bacterium]
MRDLQRVLVTGGCGFIGSNFVRHLLDSRDVEVRNIDVLTYAGDPRRLEGVDAARYVHERADIADADEVARIVGEFRPDAVVHFAAESHVTRSENAGDVFHRTNVEGTRVVLDALCKVDPKIVIHISTDEVYGPCPGDPYREEDKEPAEGRATSPYAQSKALADDLARAYTGRLPLVVVRPTNCFGPYQHPEKAFPRWAIRALRGQQLPVWGDGGYVRDWLPVGDLCAALDLFLQAAEPGAVLNVGPERAPEVRNVDLVRWMLEYLKLPEDRLVFTAYDRPDHDRRYAVDATRARALGWSPATDVWSAFADTLEWYRANERWWAPLVADAEAIYADRDEVKS